MTEIASDIKRKITELRDRGAVFYVSHSGGKDSQTMLIEIEKSVPHSQIVIIHAELPEVTWPQEVDHINKTKSPDVPLIVCRAGKTFFEMVDRRRMFPSPKYRQCTSDLKRDPINKVIRQNLKARGKSLGVSCIGIRAEESPGRSRQTPFRLNKRLSKAGREVYDMLPIHNYLLDDVWRTIRDANQEPHWVYAAGMTRLSCCFCIMASRGDLKTAARLMSELYKRFVLKEKELDFTLQSGASLEEITGIQVDGLAETLTAACPGDPGTIYTPAGCQF